MKHKSKKTISCNFNCFHCGKINNRAANHLKWKFHRKIANKKTMQYKINHTHTSTILWNPINYERNKKQRPIQNIPSKYLAVKLHKTMNLKKVKQLLLHKWKQKRLTLSKWFSIHHSVHQYRATAAHVRVCVCRFANVSSYNFALYRVHNLWRNGNNNT